MTNRPISAYAKGIMGEDRACEYLTKRGMVPLFRRYHSSFGEIDLIMLSGETLVFVEVKAREHGTRLDALGAVTHAKRRRIVQTARCFLSEHPEHAGRVMRFDVLALSKGEILHLTDAFQGSEW